jgi:hypothetical protein
MRKTVSRSLDGRVQGNLEYWLNTHEDESWKDEKVQADKIMFPSHKGSMHGEVHTFHISQLNKN